jgi:LacI family transcriptional regulator
MKDIAQDLGVSVVTVSKVLRNHADISAETRERVLRRMKELNYQPNLAARALVTGKSYIMGLVVPDLIHPFFAQIAKKMSYVLRDHGYSLVTSSSNEEAELEEQEIERMLARRVDALFVASTQWSVERLLAIEQQRTPFILIDRTFVGLTANFVGVDDEAVGFLATRHLIEVGCRNIAHISGPEVSTAIGRIEGYKRALAGHDRELRPDYIIRREHGDDLSDISGDDAMRRLLTLQPRPDGVFCYNDPTAMGAMRAILDAGLRIPEDVAVVGCGNVFYADYLRVPLTCVDQDSDAIAEHAVNLAVSLIGAKVPVRAKTILLQPKLVVRASSQRLHE